MFAALGEPAPASPAARGRRRSSACARRFQTPSTTPPTASLRARDRRAYSLSRLDLEALIPVARGELPLVVVVDRASDIEAALRLGQGAHLKLILAGAAEGWMVAGQIAAAKVPVLLNPLTTCRRASRASAPPWRTPARLHKAGVTMAFMTGDAHNAATSGRPPATRSPTASPGTPPSPP